ncbi:restriction endonuclease subunit S [Proteinivorax tanatarense]|uniref:Restriction endonuclease subunit S n=1 Tax=Proteinivorax tanatarense TaxID=1260629 RepID=A0AAU7VMT1_9FIRM
MGNKRSNNWRVGRLQEIAYVVMGQSPPGSSYNTEGKGVGLINGPTEFTKKHPVVKQWTVEPKKYCENRDVLLCVRGSSTGRINISDSKYCIGRGVAAISARENMGVTDYIYYLIDHKVNNLLNCTTGSTFPNLSSAEIKGFEIKIPSLPEQQKIASILSTWDKAIQLKEKLIQQKKEQKKGLMQKLLTGEKRLPGFEGEWEEVKLGEVIKESKDKTLKHNQYPVLTSSRKGIYLQDKYFSKQVASRNNTGYKIIKEGEFTYRTMSDDGKFVFNRLADVPVGIVSPAYVVFRAVEMEPVFLEEFLNSHQFNRYIRANVQGGTRLSYKYKSLSETIVKIPSKDEQKAIADIILQSNKEIKLLQQELEQLKQQKKGLMQLLLTGKVRVKV